MTTIVTTTRSEHEHSFVIDQATLLMAIESYLDAHGGTPPPSTARLTITVPRGGDYSGMVLDVADVGGITVTWMDRSVTRG